MFGIRAASIAEKYSIAQTAWMASPEPAVAINVGGVFFGTTVAGSRAKGVGPG